MVRRPARRSRRRRPRRPRRRRAVEPRRRRRSGRRGVGPLVGERQGAASLEGHGSRAAASARSWRRSAISTATASGDVAVAAPRDGRPDAHAARARCASTPAPPGRSCGTGRARQPGELFGRMVVAAGDLDGDGVDDLAIGAPWHRREAADRVGRVELRSGRSGDGPERALRRRGRLLVRLAHPPRARSRRTRPPGVADRLAPPSGRRQGGRRRARPLRAARGEDGRRLRARSPATRGAATSGRRGARPSPRWRAPRTPRAPRRPRRRGRRSRSRSSARGRRAGRAPNRRRPRGAA